MLRSLFASPARSASAVCAATPVRRGAAAAAVVERLEGRALLALASGFERVNILRVDGFEGFQVSTSMEFAPDGRMFVADNADGQIEVIKRNPTTGKWAKAPAPALTLAIDNFRERGIESLAFDPNYSSNRYLYVYYSKADPSNPKTENNGSRNRLVRYQTRTDNPDLIDPATATILIDDVPTPTGIHNGGAMHFGADGMMYLGIGDGGARANAQDLSNLNGKILRLDIAAFNRTGSRASLIPSDNPFAGQSGKRGEIWAYGLRNPYTGNIKPGTNTVFINDVGQASWEEINQITRGGNFGWPDSEGVSANPDHVDPIHAYTHFPNGTSQPRVQAAITGGVFYDGEQFPAQYRGKYFFGDYTRNIIRILDPLTKNVTTFGDGLSGYVDLDVDPIDGSLWGLTVGANLHRFRWVGTGVNQAPTAAASADKTSGQAPLTVRFSGAGSVDPDGDTLSYRWTFGDGSAAQTARDVSHTFTRSGTYTARLLVDDGNGATDEATVTVRVGNDAPIATINLPASGALFSGGQTIPFSGTATDAQDGELPASAFAWTIVFHHADHIHPFITPPAGSRSGSFVIPTGGEFDADQWYRIHLTVTDAEGATHSVSRDVLPRKSTVKLATNVAGLGLRLDGSPFAGGSSFVGVEGMIRSIGAPATQTLNGKTYEFVSWSDGKPATHEITTPVSDTTYTATYREVTGGTTITTKTVRAGADAFVRNGSYAGVNYGSDVELLVKKGPTGYERRAYLKFSLGDVSADTTNVRLRLYGNLHLSSESNLPVALYGVPDTSWTEGGIAFSNAPSLASAPLLGTQAVRDTTKRWYEFDVTNYARTQKAAGRSLATFALIGTQTSPAIIHFHSDESGSNQPQLVVTTSTSTTNPPPPSGQTPFKGSPFVVGPTPVIIQAEDFDNGGQGVAYHDTTSGNTGGATYRPGEAVDLKNLSSDGGGYRLSDVKAGEWLEYTIDVQTSGLYDLSVRASNPGAGGRLHLEVDGVNVTGSLAVPDTNSYTSFRTLTKSGVNLTAGTHVLRLAFDVNSTHKFAASVNWLGIAAT